MKKYFFVSFKAINGTRTVGGGGLVVGCSCGFDKMEEPLLNYYNGRAKNEANDICITSLTILDKKTAAQLSENFTNGALIIDDGEKEEENQVCIERWVARDKDGTLCLYVGKEPPKKEKSVWDAEYDDFIELDGSIFPEVQWSDTEPTRVRLVIDK